ncbi:MAG: flavodoxin [Eubacterium sp.]
MNIEKNKIAVIYWSGSENTEIMAEKISNGIDQGGVDADLYNVSDFPPDKIDRYDKIAFGCPSMEGETLEQNNFQPFFEKIEKQLKHKKVALFGSYGWGNGEWMKDWEDRVKKIGSKLFDEGLIVNEFPDEASRHACVEFGKAFASF